MTTFELETCAEKALMETLRQMSGVTLKDLRRAFAGSSRPAGILARIDVFGHGHTLVCAVERDGDLAHVRADLRDCVKRTTHFTECAKPVIIAPYLSSEAQTACKEADAGFLDLEGNARLFVGEIFICERSFPCRTPSLTMNGEAMITLRRRFKPPYKGLSKPGDPNDKVALEGKSVLEALSAEANAQRVIAPQEKR